MISKDEMLAIFQESGALLSGHFLLTSGLHSPQYFQCALLLQYPQHTTRLCTELAQAFSGTEIDVVIAPAVGGIVVGQEVGRALGVRAIFAERESGQMSLRRGFHIERGERAVVVEDVITTGGSTEEVIRLVEKWEGRVTGVGALVDRSVGALTWDVPMESLMKLDVMVYAPEECPLCRDKIPVLKPGSRK